MEKRGSANTNPGQTGSAPAGSPDAGSPATGSSGASAGPSSAIFSSATPAAGALSASPAAAHHGRPPRKQRLREKRPERFAELLRIATHALAHDGYAAMNVNHIAEDAGVGVGTLYNYFDDKDDLFLTCVAAASANDLRIKRGRIELDRPALEVLRALFRVDRELAKSDPDGQQLLRSVFYGINSHLSVSKLAQEISSGTLALIEQVLEKGVAQKVFALAKNEVPLCAAIINTMMETLPLQFAPAAEDRGGDGEAGATERAFELLCRGILTKQARLAEKIS